MKEIWKDVSGYEGLYRVSNLGKVFSVGSNIILSSKPNNRGYVRVHLNKNRSVKAFSVHRLVANAFLEKNTNKPDVNHINEIKTDNRVCNLEWVTRRYNNNYSASKRSKSKYYGVSWHKHNKMWLAKCKFNGVINHLGYFKNEEDAARAYMSFCATNNIE